MAAMTLHDVRHALQEGQRQQALQYLEVILEENPSADAWFLSAELAVNGDRSQAAENLRRALALDPTHDASLAMLERLTTSTTVAFTDIAQGPARHDSRIRVMLISLAAVVAALAIFMLLLKTVAPDMATTSLPADQVKLYQSDAVFAIFTGSSLPLADVKQTVSPDANKRTLKFAVPDADNHGPYAVDVIVYDSLEALNSDLDTREALVRTSQIHITGNVLFAYDNLLRGEAVERQMLYLFESIGEL